MFLFAKKLLKLLNTVTFRCYNLIYSYAGDLGDSTRGSIISMNYRPNTFYSSTRNRARNQILGPMCLQARSLLFRYNIGPNT